MRISDWSSDVCSSDLFLHRRAFEAAGILFLVLAGALALAMASYDSLDPSLNSAAGRPAQNLLGGPGALAADIALQSFGLAAIVLVFGLAVWGISLVRHRRIARFGWRVLALLVAL